MDGKPAFDNARHIKSFIIIIIIIVFRYFIPVAVGL